MSSPPWRKPGAGRASSVPSRPVCRLEPLTAAHRADAFDCGVPALNSYLTRQALADQRAEKTRTYVAVRGTRILGFFSLAAASVEPQAATPRLARGQDMQAIPVILLGRFAVDCQEQGTRLGEAMLVEALRKASAAADTIGARALLVHAKNDLARSFYERYGFEPSPTSPLHLMLPMKDIRKSLRA